MAVYVDKQICNGCGTCVTACPNEAIHLTASHVVIEESACTECGTCIDLCPRGAMQMVAQPALTMPSALAQVAAQPAALAQSRPNWPEWLGTVCSFLGREVLPVVLDGLITTCERRLAARSATASGTSIAPQVSPNCGRGQRRQQRRRTRRVA